MSEPKISISGNILRVTVDYENGTQDTFKEVLSVPKINQIVVGKVIKHISMYVRPNRVNEKDVPEHTELTIRNETPFTNSMQDIVLYQLYQVIARIGSSL